MSHKYIFLALCMTSLNHFSMQASQKQSILPSDQNLEHAINNDDSEDLTAELAHGSSPNTKVGQVPILILATVRGKNNAVQTLLDYAGINKNATDPKGNTAAHWAAYTGNIAGLVYLKTLKAKLNTENDVGNNPLSIALQGTQTYSGNKDYANCVTLLMTAMEDGDDQADEDSD